MPLPPADIALIVIVTSMAAGIAYLHDPRLKALLYTIPLPFLAARYASGVPVDATHVLGVFTTLAFLSLTLLGLRRFRLPIAVAEGIGIAVFCGIGFAVGRWVPSSDAAFWVAVAVVVPALLALRLFLKPVHEPGHRTQMPVWIKVPLILLIVVLVVWAKGPLRGFMPTFPFVGTFAVYETRRSLRTTVRQFVRFCLGFVAALVTMRLVGKWTEWVWVELAIGYAVGFVAYFLASGCRLTLRAVPDASPPRPVKPGGEGTAEEEEEGRNRR